MALIATYGCPSCRSVVEAMAAMGIVWPSQASPVRGGGSPYSMASGGNTYTFYSGPEGGPHPVFTGGLGYIGDLLAWNGYRCAQTLTPAAWTTFAEDPEAAAMSQASYSTSNTKGYILAVSMDTSVDGKNWDYTCIKMVGFYSQSLGSYNYVVTGDDAGGVGSVSMGGMSLSEGSINALAAAIAGMIQIINNVTVGTELQQSASDMKAALESLSASLGEFGLWGSFDAASDLLIKKFGVDGPFNSLHTDMQAMSDALGPGGTAGDVLEQITEMVALLGAGGLLGALSAGGSIGAALSNLSPIMTGIGAIGNVANAIAQFQQSEQLANIANATNNVSGNVANLITATSNGSNFIGNRISDSTLPDLATRLGSSLMTLNSTVSGVVVALNNVDGRLHAVIGDVDYDVVEAIHAWAGGGGGGGSVDLTALIAKLEEIRQAIPTSGGSFDMQALKAILDEYFIVDRNGTRWNISDLIMSLINTGWIIYK